MISLIRFTLFTLGFLVRQNLLRSCVFIDYIGPNVLCGAKNFRIDWNCQCLTLNI
jgi:hypothetical protein